MTATWDSTRKLILDQDLDEMELIGNRMFTVGVPAGADPEFKAYMMAAGSTHAFGNRSVDNTLRRHCDKWVQEFEKQAEVDARGLVGLRRAIARQATARCKEISNLDLGENALSGTISAANILIRLDSSFRAAAQLVQLGFAFESEAVIRLGFEQVAWSNAVRELSSLEEVEATSSTRSITRLKAVFPGAGLVYNRLSDLAHVSPTTHSRFMSEADGGMMIRIKSPLAARESMRLLLILLDAFLVIGEMCFHQAGITCQNIDLKTGLLKRERPFHQLIKQFARVLSPGTPAFFESWWK